MKKHIITLILLLMTIISTDTAIGKPSINTDVGRSVLNTQKINGIDYISIAEIMKLLFPKSKSDNNSFFINHKTEIKSAAGSFYIMLKHENDIKVAQMILPAIHYKNTLFIPLETYLSSLSSLDVIKYDKTVSGHFVEISDRFKEKAPIAETIPQKSNEAPKKIKIEKSKVQINFVKTETAMNTKKEIIQIDSSANKQLIDNSRSIKEPTPNISEPTIIEESTIPFNKYYIPERLDRRVIINR